VTCIHYNGSVENKINDMELSDGNLIAAGFFTSATNDQNFMSAHSY
jgi:hypothetical protein